MPGGQRGHPDDVHVRLDGLAGHLGRGLEQRADVHVEAEVGEGGGDHLLAAVVAVLAHLGDQDARPAALGLLEGVHQASRVRSTDGDSPASLRYTPEIVRIWLACRPYTFSRASEISPTVAFARAACTASSSRLPSPPGGPGQRVQRVLARLLVALRAQPPQLLDLLGADGGVVDLEDVDLLVGLHAVLVDADDRLAAGVDAGLGAGRGLLDAQLGDARVDGLGHAARRLDLLDVLPGAAGEVVRQLLDVRAAAPRVDDPGRAGLLLDAAAGCCGRCAPRSRWAGRAPRRGRWCAATGCGPGSPPSPPRTYA